MAQFTSTSTNVSRLSRAPGAAESETQESVGRRPPPSSSCVQGLPPAGVHLGRPVPQHDGAQRSSGTSPAGPCVQQTRGRPLHVEPWVPRWAAPRPPAPSLQPSPLSAAGTEATASPTTETRSLTLAAPFRATFEPASQNSAGGSREKGESGAEEAHGRGAGLPGRPRPLHLLGTPPAPTSCSGLEAPPATNRPGHEELASAAQASWLGRHEGTPKAPA